MEDKLEQFYNSIKSNPSITGLPKDYSTFKSAMADPDVSSQFFNVIKQNPSITGLPEDYNTFSSALGLQKKNPIGSVSTSGSKSSQDNSSASPKVSIDGDVKNAIISLEGAQMALVNKDKEIANLDKSLAGGRDVGGSFLQVDRNLEKVADGLDKKLAKERQFIQNSVQSTISKVKPVLNKVIDEKISDATISNFTKNIEGKIVPDELKINSYAEDIIKQTGLSEGKYVKDFIYNEIKANVANKLTQPKVEKIFNDLYKKKYGVSVEEDINKDFVDKFKDVNAVKAQAEVKLNTVQELAKTDFTSEMSVISSEFKTRADVVNTNYKQITEQINKQAESLNAQYQSGSLPQEQYSAGIAKLNSDLETNYKAYKGNFDQMADEFLKTQNAVASRYDKRLRRQYQEIDNAAKVEVENRLTKYKSQYKVPVELEERYRKTYQEAADKFRIQESVIDYQLDKAKGAATVLGESLLSGLGQGVKGLSYMADFDLGKVYGEYLETAFRLSDANIESMKDLLDPIKLARSSGQTIGAMAPMLAGNALIATATVGTSIPVQLAMTGGFGFLMESMQMAGDMYDRKMQQTGVVADAEKAAAKVIQANTMLLPLYAFDGLPLISNATLGIKNRALRGLAKGGIETVTEITQEVPQSAFEDIIYKNQPLADVVDKFDVTKKENRDEIFNTVLNVIPSSVLMGSAPTFLGYANKPIAEIRGRAAFAKEQLEGLTDNAMEQFFYDMQLTKGATFTKAFLSAAYSSGNLNDMQLIKLTNIVDKSIKVLEDAQELKLSNGESKVYAAYEFAADAYTKQAEAMEDGVAKEALLAKAAAIKKQAVNYLNTKEGDYVVLVLPNGEQYVYQPDFFTSSVNNYNTLKNLLAKKLATAKVVSSSKEGDKVKARITGYVRILDSAPEDIKEFTEGEGGMNPEIQSKLDNIAIEIGELEISLEQQSLSPESKQKIQSRLNELDGISQELLAGNNQVEYVSEDNNFFKILLDGTKEPITEAEFETAVSIPKPINEKNGEMVTINFGGKAITGTVEVDEGGKASIYSGGVVYELPNETEYVDYASPVRISDTDGSIEFDGISYPEVRIESIDGTETAVLIDENGKPKTVKDPKIVEEFKYQITLANLAEITEEEAITLLSEYEQDSQTKANDATEGGANQVDEQKRSEEDIKLQEAIDEIDLIELIALEELDNADANAKLVEYKPANSKDTKVYLVKKNADGTVSATLDGKKVRRGAVLSSLNEAYDMQSKEGSKRLATKLQEQVNALKADVEAKLFGRTQVTEPVKQEPAKQEEPITQQENATQETSQQVIQGGEQGNQLQRQGTDEGQQKAGERKGDERKVEKPKANLSNSIKQSREEQEVVEEKNPEPKKEPVKKDDSKPAGLSPLETKFKETPEALSKDELKEVLDTKRERYKKAMATIEKGELEGDVLKAKQKAVDSLESTIEDLVKRIDSKVSTIVATEEQLKKAEKEIKDYFKSLGDTSLGIAKTPEQMVQSMREDIKFFNAIVDFAYLSIKLRGLKTIEAFKAELEKQLGVKFDKLPQELKDAWSEAKKKVIDEKKQAPTVKQTIKEATEQKTSPEKVATFAEYMAAKYKGMAEGAKNRFTIIKDAMSFVRGAVDSDLSRAKISALINKALAVKYFDDIKGFEKYVDSLVSKKDYYEKVAQLEGLAKKLGKALRNDKFGAINPQISRILSINPENLTESGIDKYIELANELLSGKVADVTNLESTLTQLKTEERNFIEGKLAAGLINQEELVKLTDKINQLSEEKDSNVLTDAKKKAASAARILALKELTDMFDKKRAEIMEYASGDKVISNAKDYTSLLAAIKKYNKTLDSMVASGFISEDYRDLNIINLNSKELTLLEESIKELLTNFRKSLTDQIKSIISSINNQYETGGIRARLFENLSDFDKKIYDPIIRDILTIPLNILPDLDISDLNVLFNAVEQLNNGYISPKLLESIEIIEAKAYQNTIAENADKLYATQVGADGVYKNKLSPIASSVSEFKSWSELADFMKMFNYQDIKTAFTDGFAKIFGEYILTPVQKSLVRYKILFENTITPIIELDDNLESFFNYKNARILTGKPSTADVVRNVLGIFFIQADHFRHEDFDKFTNDQKDLAKYLLGEYDKKNLNVSRDRMDLLKEAYSQIDGDISTKQGLQDAMDKYFAENPRAKKLFYAIRNSINNEIAPMNKISIERDGGSFENDNDYFQWQKVGENVKGLESTFQDMIQERYDKDFKRKANATYKRKGSPFFMREFNATKAYYKMAEEAVINYEVEPVIIPFRRAVEQLANKYKLEGKDNLAMFLQAANEYVFFSAKLMFEKHQANSFNKLYSSAASFIRRYRLGNIIRTLPDLGSTEAKLALSMNPAEYARYLAKQTADFNDDSFLKLAELVSSPIQFKVTRANVENMQFNKPSTERRLDALTGIADRIAQTTSWKAFMMANFKKISGKELNVKEMTSDPLKYYIDNKYALDKAGFLSDQQVDAYTVNQFDLGRAPTPRWLPALTVSKMIPFMTKEKAIRMLTVNRNSKATIYLNFMGSYTGTEANLLSSAFQKIAVQKDYIGGFRDIASIMTSQFMYMSAMAAANAIASVVGFALTNIYDGDDEDEFKEIMEYAKKEWEAFSELYQDPVKLMQTYVLTLALIPLAKYPTLSRSAVAIGIGLWSGAEIGASQNKAETKKAKNKWEERYKVIGDKLYVNPIPFGVRDPKITPTWGDYANMMDPISGFYLKLADDQLNPKREGNVISVVKELNKDGEADKNKMLMAGANLFMLSTIGYGNIFAPTYIKIMNEKAKSQIREDIEKKKQGGKSSQNKNPFGSSDFGSKGLGGGL